MCFSCVFLCSVCSLRIKFNIDLSCSEMRRLYWLKLKKKKKHKKAKRRVRKSSCMKGTFKIPGTFPGTFNLDIVVQVIILLHSLKKGNRVNG